MFKVKTDIMQLMTRGFNNNSKYGLISIEEAPNNSSQNLLFAIPLERYHWESINNFLDLERYLNNNTFSVYVSHDGKQREVYLDSYGNHLHLNFLNKTVKFYIDPNLNFSNVNRNSLFNFSIITDIILSGIIALQAILIGLLLRETSFKKKRIQENEILFKRIKFKKEYHLLNEYVGDLYYEKYYDNKFIILSLISAVELDKLFLEDNVFII